ncbi:hypothetical protein [Carboxylicivirga marina]|uniref:hypothetical protein n=1 Tax=Carboxylicivirga marina TaxID=2800988 RepID=UPI0025948964|nr:hypothetical protein [uncultured Carboxylicivirga sp.]
MINIFKRKNSNIPKVETKVKTALCIPGIWENRSDIVSSITKENLGDFLFAGTVIMNLKTKQGFELEIHERDENMREAFKCAGIVNRLSDNFLNQIEQHNYVIYLIGETGSLKDAKAISEAGEAILKAGGIGIKVESTGKAFSKEHWTSLLMDFQESNLYEMFVLDSIHDGNSTTYTCGMHNLGFKDCIVSNIKFQESVHLLTIFGYYQIVDKPDIKEKQTFSEDINSPVYQIVNEPNQPYKGDELFENPYGMWRLKRK